MGVSFRHEVYFIVSSDETEYLNNLPEYLPGPWTEAPVIESSYSDNIIHLSSGGYNIFDLFSPSFPRPDSWLGLVHRISPCQGQDFDIVDWISRSEFDDQYEMADDEDEDYNPMAEYTDPDSDYWEMNQELNLLADTPNLMSDYDDEEATLEEEMAEEDRRYQAYLEDIEARQNEDILKGLAHFKSQLA